MDPGLLVFLTSVQPDAHRQIPLQGLQLVHVSLSELVNVLVPDGSLGLLVQNELTDPLLSRAQILWWKEKPENP